MLKSLRLMMHALAVFMLLVAVVTPVFWVRSRTRDEVAMVQWNSVASAWDRGTAGRGLFCNAYLPGR